MATLLNYKLAKRLPYADHIIILSSKGEVAEQGTFKELIVSGGYVSSFALPPPDWNYEMTRPLKGFLEKQLTEKTLLSSQPSSSIEKSDRQTGDVAVYLYYVKAVGWIPTLVFIVAISAFVFCMSFPSKSSYPSLWLVCELININQRFG